MAEKTAVAKRARKTASPAKKRSRPNPKAYNEVVAKAGLVDLRLIATNLEIKPDALDGDRSELELKVGDELVEWSLDTDEGRLWGRISFAAVCREAQNTTILVTGDYLVGYSVDGATEADACREFIARVGRFACYPYFRTLFATLTGQAGLVFPPLPVLKEGPRFIVPPEKGKRKSAATEN